MRRSQLLAGKPFPLFMIIVLFCSTVLLGSALSGCAPTARPAGQQGDNTPFLPPTPLALSITTATSESVVDGAAEQATEVLDCQDSLSFLNDLTIPDGTVVEADATLDKRWEVENSGNCNWGENYQIRLIAGPEMGVKKEQALFPARSGSRATIRILFKAPAEPGSYRSAWQAFNARGEAFGDPFFIDIVVGE